MKSLLAVIFIILMFCSCFFDTGDGELSGESRGAVCRHQAVMAALVYGEHYPVRIVHGLMDTEEAFHCQAQAYIDGEWRFLDVAPSQICVVTNGKDENYTISAEYDLKEFMDERWFNSYHIGDNFVQ